jgi:hypothetical protein
VAKPRTKAGCEVLREAGILLGVLYPLEKSVYNQLINWCTMAAVIGAALTLIVVGIVLEPKEDS